MSSGHAGRLFDDLTKHFGSQNVFMDVTHIKPGDNFVTVLEDTVRACDVLIAFIGRRWLTSTDADGQRRLESPTDYVRLEILAALDRNIRLIPVLVQGAAMPHPKDLPEALVDLAKRHAHEVHDNRWKEDVARLIEMLEQKGAATLQERAIVLDEERLCFASTPEALRAVFGGVEWKFGKKLKARSIGPGALTLTSEALRFVASDGKTSQAINLLDIIKVETGAFTYTKWFRKLYHRYVVCTFYMGEKTQALVFWNESESVSYGFAEKVQGAIKKKKRSPLS